MRPALGRRTWPSDLLSVLALVEATPRLRHELSQRLGRAAADLVLAMTHALAQGLTPGPPIGLLADAAVHAMLVSEINARRTAWQHLEPELCTNRTGECMQPVQVSPRPVPLPHGPVERYADRASFLALAAATGVAAFARDRHLARTVLAVATPKAARLSREVFAARLGRALCARRVVPLDATVLRRLDRLDTVVIDSRVLTTGRFTIRQVHGVDSNLPAEETNSLRARAARLMDVCEPGKVITRNGWTLCPLSKVAPSRQPAVRAVADRVRTPGGVTLGLTRGQKLVAVGVAVPELAPHAAELVASARSVGTLVVAGVGSGLGERFSADTVVPNGTRLAGEIRTMQQQGRAVALVARSGSAALTAADAGIGVLYQSGSVPWAADLLCGPGLQPTCRVLNSVGTARAVSHRGALISLYGSFAAALLALSGPRTGAFGRARIAVNAAAVAGMAMGVLSARSVDKRPDPIPTDEALWQVWNVDTTPRPVVHGTSLPATVR